MNNDIFVIQSEFQTDYLAPGVRWFPTLVFVRLSVVRSDWTQPGGR